MNDDFEPVQQQQPQDDFEPVTQAERPAPTAADAIPEAFMDRLRAGQALGRILQAGAKGAEEGVGTGTPTGFSDEMLNYLIDKGVFHDPARGRPGPLQSANEAILMPTAKLWEAIQRGTAAGISGAAGAFSQLNTEFGASQGTAERAKNEVINAGNWMMIEAGMGRFARPSVDGGAVVDHQVGTLPTPQDFSTAGKVMESPHAEANLRRMWSEDGIHPAEAVHDAQADAFLKHEITAPHENIVATPSQIWEPVPGSQPRVNEFGTVSKDTFQFPINDAAGNPIGQIEYIKGTRFDPDANAITIRAAGIHEPEARGSGYGTSAYKQIADWALDKGMDVYSSGDTNELSDKVYQRLKSQGYNVTQEGDTFKISPPKETPRYTQADLLEAQQIYREAEWRTRQAESNPAHERFAAQAKAKLDEIEQSLKANSKRMWDTPPEEMDEAFGRGASLSAAVTDPADIPLDRQPASPSSSLIARAQDAVDKLFDIGRDIQMKLTPMARGSVDSMATVKDYMNAMRRNAWDSSRIDTDIAKRFSPEQRERMARAMEEESLSLRLGEPVSAREHQGLATLQPDERAAVQQLDQAQQLAWLRARDAGVVEGDGIPMHFPRMAIGATGDGELGRPASLTQMYGIRKNSPYTRQRQYVEAEQTEKALKAKYGDQAKIAWDIRAVNLATKMLEDATAGRTLIKNIQEVGKRTGDETVAEGFKPADGWFTVDHPAFQKWRPKFGDDGAVLKDAEGNPQFEQVPIYVRSDFEGPIRAALWGKTGDAYRGMMALKGKTMGLIMNSPMIHNLVELGRAFPAIPTRIHKVYFDGYRAKNDPGIMHEAIDAGLVPIGKRFFNQDINAIMEAPDLTPGRSWTAKVLAAVPGLFDEAAGTAVKQAIDKAGDFWHNTLLWDRIADLQAGLYVNFRGDLMAKGMDQSTASRIAAHWANRYAGALPKEAMSEMATKVSNFMFFSRSFTFGNLGVMKDMLTGLPKDVLAQIERDAGFKAGSIEGAGEEGAVQQAVTSAKSIARRKAMMTVALDVALMYAGNSILQNAFNILLGGSSLSEEEHGYLRRFRDVINEASVHPLSLLQPFSIAQHLSATGDNEPTKQDRNLIGYAKDGTAIYARNPVGKIGEEFVNYFTSPIDMLRKKEGTIARPLLQIISNDAGFGRKVYDPQADTPAKYANNVWMIVKHLMTSQLPVGQISAFSDLVKGEGDKYVNALQAFGPIAGMTFSKGAPGGPAVGEMYDVKSRREFAISQAMPDLRRQIQRGDIPGAQKAMGDLGMDPSYQRWVIKTTLDPRLRLSARGVRDFYNSASPEARARFERAQGRPAAP